MKYFLLHELIEWYSCPKKAYHLHHHGCKTLMHASHFREQLRVINFFLQFKQESTIHTAPPINDETIEASIERTNTAIQEKQSHIFHATLVYNNVLVYIPYMQWNKKIEAWKIIFPSITHGVKQEHLQIFSLIQFVCKKLAIPLNTMLLSYYNINNNEKVWVDFNVTLKVQSFYEKEYNAIIKLFNFMESEEAEDYDNWKGCNREYCDYCSKQLTYTKNSIQTLRRAKMFIQELEENNIANITDIPSDVIPNNSVLHRQIDAVCTDESIFIHNEVQTFMDTLTYPRYYLDFEAFNTAFPYHYAAPYIQKQWAFTPFLYSLQWQDTPHDKVHTQLWAMLPGKNQITQMWKSIKTPLEKAGSIIVYGSQFEKEMIHQLAHSASENAIGDVIINKIIDLQTLFFDLSAYHPDQKGKISLKTITPIWVSGDYNNLKVNEGIGANYYFTAMTDEKLQIFDEISHIPYIKALMNLMTMPEDKTITLQDIATYCKYDTEVMIRIVDQLEHRLDKKPE